jgi:hypothetical protein
MSQRRLGQPRKLRVNNSKPIEQDSLDKWFDTWFTDCPAKAREQLEEIIKE